MFHHARITRPLVRKKGDGDGAAAIVGDEPHDADPEDTASHVERTMEQVRALARKQTLACCLFFFLFFFLVFLFVCSPSLLYAVSSVAVASHSKLMHWVLTSVQNSDYIARQSALISLLFFVFLPKVYDSCQ